MLLDLHARAGLTDPERWLIASDLHVILLDEIFIATKWTRRESVFHGGTALHLACDSPRLSEDLDFMVIEPGLAVLAAAAHRIFDRVRMRILTTTPGAALAVRVKDRGPGPDRLVTWDVRWHHPNRIGKVQVKLEFYAVAQEALAGYGSHAELRLPGLGSVRLTVEIPVPNLAAFWGDKVKAFATRPDVKWRDIYDLGFISRQFEVTGRPSSAELSKSLRASARIYSKETDEIASSLGVRLRDGTFDRTREFVDNMANWFAAETFSSFCRSGTLLDMFSRARSEIELALALLKRTRGASRRGER
jgi:hypothetical protein